ncbi:FecR domain-containing protein [Janthinobacterium sp. AD80]
MRADYRTATGERRDVALADGSVLSLNTGSAVNVRF